MKIEKLCTVEIESPKNLAQNTIDKSSQYDLQILK